MKTPFAPNRDLTSVSLAFTEKRFIADAALPRFPVQEMRYSYDVYDFQEGFHLVDDTVGRKGTPKEIEFHAKEIESITKDHALDDVVPVYDDKSVRGTVTNYHGRIAERLTNRIALGREKRVADLLFNSDVYPAENRLVLAGGDSFSDFDNSDPVETIVQSMQTPIMRPNTGVIGRKLYDFLTRHPKVMKGVNATSGDTGVATRQQIAAMFELDNLWVGEGFYIAGNLNTETEKTPVRLWGASMALYYLDQLGGPQENPSFGFTAEFETRFSSKEFEKNIGMRGGHRIRVGESVDEQICAPRLGMLIKDPTAEAA